jgi:hypothetical protein
MLRSRSEGAQNWFVWFTDPKLLAVTRPDRNECHLSLPCATPRHASSCSAGSTAAVTSRTSRAVMGRPGRTAEYSAISSAQRKNVQPTPLFIAGL